MQQLLEEKELTRQSLSKYKVPINLLINHKTLFSCENIHELSLFSGYAR